ncbi:hypothetical protein PMZ80_006710 [Knufia obscura]|uniref:Glyoxalase-like domain-containing protein n=2 Tax=Knufia TaxID=430999 RepID=A0AAN8EML4_9EURO|nr:hypothetical protein PMZ80_006710 [Knufia obscura]KAK5948088.1 hypothetical protein OHC33_010930 [Knufia fluminis]
MASAVPTISPTRLRQIALITDDLDRAEHILTEVVFVDPGVAQWGLKNILVAIGGDIIEICAPTKPDTTVGRLLKKRGEGGYMIIMQTLDAAARRRYIEDNGLAKVIWGREHDDVTCVQYHPKGIAGGMMPELDSHTPSPSNPTPLASAFSPWHACGSEYEKYAAGMERASHLKLVGAACRLGPGQTDTQGAAQQWQNYFGVERQESELVYTNARLKFVAGSNALPEGLESITIQVQGKDRLNEMLAAARREGLGDDGGMRFLGLTWRFVLAEEPHHRSSKL